MGFAYQFFGIFTSFLFVKISKNKIGFVYVPMLVIADLVGTMRVLLFSFPIASI